MEFLKLFHVKQFYYYLDLRVRCHPESRLSGMKDPVIVARTILFHVRRLADSSRIIGIQNDREWHAHKSPKTVKQFN